MPERRMPRMECRSRRWAPVRPETAVDAALSLPARARRSAYRSVPRPETRRPGRRRPGARPDRRRAGDRIARPVAGAEGRVGSRGAGPGAQGRRGGVVGDAAGQGQGPPALKLVDRLWKATDPEERKKLAERLAGRPVVSVLEMIDFTSSVLKDAFDLYPVVPQDSAQSRVSRTRCVPSPGSRSRARAPSGWASRPMRSVPPTRWRGCSTPIADLRARGRRRERRHGQLEGGRRGAGRARPGAACGHRPGRSA